MKYLKALLKDPLFCRVCMLLWGTAWTTFAVFGLFSWQPTGWLEWAGYAFVALLAILGAWFCYHAMFGSDESVDKFADFISDGGEWVGLIAVLLVCTIALPIVALVRAVRPRTNGSP